MSTTPTTLKNCVELQLLIHYHVYSTEHPDIGREAPASLDAIDRLLALGLLCSAARGLKKGPGVASWKTSEKGAVMVNKLLATPLPVATWS